MVNDEVLGWIDFRFEIRLLVVNFLIYSDRLR